MYDKVFSEFEIESLGLKQTRDFPLESDDKHTVVECVGSLDEEMDVRIITKKCKGVESVVGAKGTGRGKLKLTAHIPWSVYAKAYGLEQPTLADGVYAYGKASRHAKVSVTVSVSDESGARKLKAYPNCIVTKGKTSKITNGETEVAETELELDVNPDSYGNGVYEHIIVDGVNTDISANTWMESFDPAKMQKSGV